MRFECINRGTTPQTTRERRKKRQNSSSIGKCKALGKETKPKLKFYLQFWLFVFSTSLKRVFFIIKTVVDSIWLHWTVLRQNSGVRKQVFLIKLSQFATESITWNSPLCLTILRDDSGYIWRGYLFSSRL